MKVRGISGSVRGLTPRQVDAMVLACTRQFGGGTFSRQAVEEFLVRKFNVTPHQAQGVIDQLLRLPWVRSEAHGRHLLPPSAELLAKHRRWRLPAGRLGLADVLELVGILEHAKEAGWQLTPRLEETLRRARQALKHLRVRSVGKHLPATVMEEQ